MHTVAIVLLVGAEINVKQKMVVILALVKVMDIVVYPNTTQFAIVMPCPLQVVV
jgi:hypothetical protein